MRDGFFGVRLARRGRRHPAGDAGPVLQHVGRAADVVVDDREARPAPLCRLRVGLFLQPVTPRAPFSAASCFWVSKPVAS